MKPVELVKFSLSMLAVAKPSTADCSVRLDGLSYKSCLHLQIPTVASPKFVNPDLSVDCYVLLHLLTQKSSSKRDGLSGI